MDDSQWRLLPELYSKWNSIYKRFASWCDWGIWNQLLADFATDPDLEYLLLDSTIIRAHPCAAGPPAERGGQAQQIADKAYDSDAFVALIEELGAIPVIPARKNRTEPRYYDAHIYKERHLIECFINKIKWYRRIFSRFDKLSSRFLGFLSFVACLIWLR